MVDPSSYFSTLCGMYYPNYGMMHIKDPLLLIKRVAHVVVEAGFLSLSEWSFTIHPTPNNHKCVACVIK